MTTDRFGNEFAAGLPYARGAIIRSTEDDFVKLERARRVIERRIAARGPEAIFNFSGLERALACARWHWSTWAATRSATTSCSSTG